MKLLEIPNFKDKTVAYLIWQNPIMLAGTNTFINEMLKVAGFKNVVSAANSRYPEISLDELRELKPDYLFLSSEPFPFKGKHKKEFVELLPLAEVKLVDGEMFSWYGSRLKHFVDYIKKYLHKKNGFKSSHF